MAAGGHALACWRSFGLPICGWLLSAVGSGRRSVLALGAASPMVASMALKTFPVSLLVLDPVKETIAAQDFMDSRFHRTSLMTWAIFVSPRISPPQIKGDDE